MIDTHCHLDRYKDPLKIAYEASARGITVLAVTNLPSHFISGLPHVRNIKGVHLALGLHPLAAAHNSQERNKFLKALELTSFVGEVGLDFSPQGRESQKEQTTSFKLVAKAVSKTTKVLSIHSRNAETAVLDVLAEYDLKRCIFHWLSGSASTVKAIAAEGYYFSINPSMIDSEKGKKLISQMPPTLILTESDGPYVKVGRSNALPWDVVTVEKYLASLWGYTLDEVRDIIDRNFNRLMLPV